VRQVLCAAALTVLAGCASTPAPTPQASPSPAPGSASWDDVPYSSPDGGATIDFAVDGFDPCTPFTSTLWLKTAVVDPQLDPQATPEGGGCRWRGPGTTATVAVETGRSLRDYNADPQYRPGQRGSAGNPYWRTATTNESRECQAFLAAGPARPDTVVHVTVQNEQVEAPLSGGGEAHSCVFTETLVEATSLVLENPPAPAT